MPHFLDRHDSVDVPPEELVQLHLADLAIQDDYGVQYLTYWYDHRRHTANCLVKAPDPDTAIQVHAEAHGAMPSEIIEVDIDEVFGLLGRVADPPGDAPIDEPATRTIVFTDIVGSTEMIDRYGDEFGVELIGTHDEMVRSNLSRHKSREVKHTGDGLILAFESPNVALLCAVDLQRARAERDQVPTLAVRVGMNTGDPVTKGADLFGTAVNLAARLCDRAEAGTVLISESVRSDTTEESFRFGDLHPVKLKGFSKPILACQVVWA